MKYLVMGVNGMAGHMIALYLKKQGHCVTGLARKKSDLIDNTIICDVKDSEKVKSIVASDNYDYVINCIGILNQNAENNKSDAVYINSFFPHYLAKITEKSDTSILQLSTDCVFSGKNAPYFEDSLRDGETFYDRTKALGELEDCKNITLRGSIVGPDINTSGIGLFNWFMHQHGTIEGFKNAIWTGQSTLQLAKTIEAITHLGLTGLFNTVPDTSISKYELLKLFKKYMNKDDVEIIPCEKYRCDKTLIQSNVGVCKSIPDYETMIAEMADWISANKLIYPYNK